MSREGPVQNRYQESLGDDEEVERNQVADTRPNPLEKLIAGPSEPSEDPNQEIDLDSPDGGPQLYGKEWEPLYRDGMYESTDISPEDEDAARREYFAKHRQQAQLDLAAAVERLQDQTAAEEMKRRNVAASQDDGMRSYRGPHGNMTTRRKPKGKPTLRRPDSLPGYLNPGREDRPSA